MKAPQPAVLLVKNWPER